MSGYFPPPAALINNRIALALTVLRDVENAANSGDEWASECLQDIKSGYSPIVMNDRPDLWERISSCIADLLKETEGADG